MTLPDFPCPASPRSPDGHQIPVVMQAHLVQLRLLFTAWISHFRTLGYIKESMMDMLDKRVCKKCIELSVKDPKAREVIGNSEEVWNALVELFRAANLSLEQRSFGPADPATPGYDGPSSNVIVANSVTLLKDLSRLDGMLSMARNVLTAGEDVQNLAAQVGFDREVCAMINLCIKITARGYDGDGTTADEDKWQAAINGFKKLLITSLQFLSNLITLNERLKLMLWVELFDSSTESGGDNAALPQAERNADNWVTSATNAFMNQAMNTVVETASDHQPTSRPQRPTTPYFIFLAENRDKIRNELSLKSGVSNKEIISESTRRWNAMPEAERVHWKNAHQESLAIYHKRMRAWEAAGFPGDDDEPADQRLHESLEELPDKQYKESTEELMETLSEETDENFKAYVDAARELREHEEKYGKPNTKKVGGRSLTTPSQDDFKTYFASPELFSPPTLTEPDYRQLESAADGAKKLAEGKAQLLQRLQSHPSEQSRAPPALSPNSPVKSPVSPGEEDRHEGSPEDDEDEEEEEEDSSEDDDDYAIPGEDGRGLLTDVPLILGPNEIEVLPMIIMSGIVKPLTDKGQKQSDPKGAYEAARMINMYTIRCHLLLAQENGRNLLRELLIFVAAWDLRDEELYFKFMVKIMEAILINGLMPFAYGAFKENKDIISPAQAVILKLLTKIFHTRQGYINHSQRAVANTATKPSPLSPSEAAATVPSTFRFDVQIVHCLFSEFRQNVIPQICALIFLQGQIRFGHANVEDFPLNLWDMERMYEGVYQFLELFAILTDHDVWKGMMADWEVASELVTLLRELEVAIPKGKLVSAPPKPILGIQQDDGGKALTAPSTAGDLMDAAPSAPGSGPLTVAVEHPYDANPPITSALSGFTAPTTTGQTSTNITADPMSSDQELDQDLDPESASADADADADVDVQPDAPADFEWRNLKKLCVLVLSSLVWKNRRLQDQVRAFGGITAILSCCGYDEHNPYIREHAIMCLRFLLEGNRENQDIVRRLQARNGVSGEGVDGEAHAGDGVGEKDELGRVAVPQEVLDHHGYETFMDSKGQVGLRRKTAAAATSFMKSVTGVPGSATSSAAVRDMKAMLEQGGSLPDWMQMVMKSMPHS